MWGGRAECGSAAWIGASDEWNCAAPRCTAAVLNTAVADSSGTYSCGARMEWLRVHGGHTLSQACATVAAEFPATDTTGCGLCAPRPELAALGQASAHRAFGRSEVIAIREWSAAPTPYLATVNTVRAQASCPRRAQAQTYARFPRLGPSRLGLSQPSPPHRRHHGCATATRSPTAQAGRRLLTASATA